MPERVGRHRRDRHGLADVAGDLRRQADRIAGPRLQPALGRRRRPRSPGSRPALPACCRCSTSAAVSSGRRCRTISAARTPITASSCSASRSTRWRRPSPRWARSCCSCCAFGIILSMYGGGFATVPAYLADMFGTQFVGAIHGRLLTAWSTAGIIGPVVVNYIREFQLAAGVPRDQLYNTTMYILCAMLVAGLICNYLIKPVDPKWNMSAEEVAKLQAASAKREAGDAARLVRHRQGRARRQGRAVLGLRRHPAGLGRLEDAGERGRRSSDRRRITAGRQTLVPRSDAFPINQRNKTRGDFHASHQCLSRRHAARRRQPAYGFGPDHGSGGDAGASPPPSLRK